MSSKLKPAILATLMLLIGNQAHAGEDFMSWLFDFSRNKEVKPIDNDAYRQECQECHFAYQPGLLPARSWEKLLTADALKDHFGDNAEIDADTLKVIRGYAVDNAADNSYYKRSRKIATTSAQDPTPLRITELRYIKRKHHEIPEKMIKGNADVKSLSFCDKCHTQATKGNYDDDTVSIPNYRDWED